MAASRDGRLRCYIDQIESPLPIVLIGYSLGGNQSLKLTGEGHSRLSATVAVSTPIGLAACVRALGRRANFIYENRFIQRMQDRLKERRRQQPAAFDAIFESTDVDGIDTVYDFDDRIASPHFGFGGADNNYATQSARNYLAAIRTPPPLITAPDAPPVPFEVYRHEAIDENRNIELLAPAHGGHVAFLAKETSRFWADEAISDRLERR